MKKILLAALYSVFLVALNQLVAIPLMLDFSYIGLLVLTAAAVLGYFAVPRAWRRFFALFSLLILLTGYGIQSVYSDSLWRRFLEFPLMLLILGWIAASYGRIKWRYTLTVFSVLAVMLAAVPLSEFPFYAKFRLVYKSEHLDRRPIFPIYPIVNRGSNLYTIGDLRKLTDKELKEATPDPKENRDLPAAAAKLKNQLEHVDVLRFAPDDGYRKHPVAKEEMAALPFTSFGLAGFPYYTSSWTIEGDGVKQHFTPVDDPKTVLTSFLDPLSVTVAMDERAARSQAASRKNWADTFGTDTRPQSAGAALVGQGKFLPEGGTQLLLVGNNELRLVDGTSPNAAPIAVYKGTWEEPVTRNLTVGDIDGDGIEEVLVNSTPAKILKIGQNRTWETIWESGKKSLRFEFVEPRPGQKPLIVVQDPSAVRNQDTRFLSGYTWNNGQLIREWRVFKTNLLFPAPISPDTWISGYYESPNLYVLKPISVPWPAVLSAIYAALALAGYGYQLAQRREGRHA